MNWNQALFPSLKRRGGCAIKKMSRSNLSSRRRGGAKRKPDRAQPQEKIGEIFRPEEFRRTDHPVCSASEASRLFINAASTPPFQGVSRAVLLASAKTHKKLRGRKQRTYRRSFLRGE